MYKGSAMKPNNSYHTVNRQRNPACAVYFCNQSLTSTGLGRVARGPLYPVTWMPKTCGRDSRERPALNLFNWWVRRGKQRACNAIARLGVRSRRATQTRNRRGGAPSARAAFGCGRVLVNSLGAGVAPGHPPVKQTS